MSGMSIGGIVSGLPVEDMIAKLMYLERQPVRHLEQKQAQSTARTQAWDRVRAQVRDLEARLNEFRYASGTALFVATTSDSNVVRAEAGPAASANTYQIEVMSLARANSWASEKFGALDEALNISGTLTVDGEAIAIESTDTLIDLRNKLAATLGDKAGLAIVQTAPGQYQLTVTASKTGLANAISVYSDDLTVTEVASAENAVFKVNGLTVESESNKVTDAIPGLTLELSTVGAATVAVSHDTEGIARKLEDFVKAYNSLLSDIHKRLSYTPDLANTGFGRDDSKPVQAADPLYGDAALRSLQTQLRQLIHTPIETADGTYMLSEIGIKGAGWGDAGFYEGHLKLDSEALTKVIAETPEKLVAVLSGTDGLASRLHDFVNTYTQAGGVIATKKEEADEQARALGRRIQQLEYRLEQRELMLRRQFTQLELIMSQGQTQMAWLGNQIAALARLGG